MIIITRLFIFYLGRYSKRLPIFVDVKLFVKNYLANFSQKVLVINMTLLIVLFG